MAAKGIWRGKRVGVVYGGTSSEREVSLESGKAIYDGLLRLGYDALLIDQQADLAQILTEKNIDVVYNALHGKWGEDGCVQGLLEILRIPYTGSKVFSSALTMDKHHAKIIFDKHGLKTGEYVLVKEHEASSFDMTSISMDLPVVVKPNTEGSSMGIRIVKDQGELEEALLEAAKWGGDILIERYLKGREIQITVLGDRALGAIEVIPAEEFYDYKAKYETDSTQYIYPAQLDEQTYKRCMDMGLAAHQALLCEGVTRTDLILSDDEIYILEVNTLPGMTSHSLVPKTAAGNDISFDELLEIVLDSARLGINSPEVK